MAIDWAVTGAALSGWGSILSAAAIAWAAHKAANTFDDWKQRRATEREEEHAQRCLVAAYQVAEAFQAVRSALLHGFELDRARVRLSGDPRWKELTEKQRSRHVNGQVYFDRLAHFSERFDRLAECGPLARALFGKEVEEALGELGRQHWILTVEVEAYIHDVEAPSADPEFAQRVLRNLNDWKCEGDGQISAAIRESLKVIEAKLLPVLKG